VVILGGKEVGGGRPTYITFEAGPTHNGLQSAKKLIQMAAKAGADAVKFQVIDAMRLVADHSIEISYGVLKSRNSEELETVTEPLIEPLRRRMLTNCEWRELKSFADNQKLAFFATACFKDEVDFLKSLGVHSIKIASADIDQLDLIEYVAKTGLCVQLDTGSATIGEVEAAVDKVRNSGNENIIIHHCPTGYPARLDGINLNIIPTLKRMFPYPIAFSDHSAGWNVDIAAVALGADMVEKTITENRATRSIEHVMSLEASEAASFVQQIKEIKQFKGTSRRLMTAPEIENRLKVRRSAYAAKDLKKGMIIVDEDIDFRRPGYGLSASQFSLLRSRVICRDIECGSALTLEDFS
jgi:N,N'-diacetyllegionaminate synthase